MNLDILRIYIENYDSAWRLSDPMLFKVLPELLETYRPKRVLELGPGASSLVLLPWCLANDAVYQGLDHIGPYHEKHQNTLEYAGLPRDTTLALPLLNGDQWYIGYNPYDSLLFRGFDLVVVDGPISGRNSARAWEAYRAWYTPQTVWVIDDVHRTEEWEVAVSIAGLHGRTRLVDDPNFPPRRTAVIVP